MKLLLDTHVFLWIFLDRGRFSPKAESEIADPSNEIWLSPLSILECLILAEKGRVQLPPDPHLWLRRRLAELSPHEAKLTNEIAFMSRRIKLPHGDPADRFLAASAAAYDLVLLTADKTLLSSKEYATLPAA